jgi:hypothetical protein
MIGIKVYGEFLELLPNTVVPLRLNSPIFNDENIIEGSYTLPFNLPVGESSPHNDRLLTFPGLAEGAGNKKEHEAELYFDGVLLYTGILVVRKGTANEAIGNFKFGLSRFKTLLRKVSVPELVREEIVLDDATLVRKIFIKPSGTASSPYRIKVNNTLFSGDTLTDLVTNINASEAEPKVTATLIDTGNSPGGLTPDYIELKPAFSNDPLSPLSINSADDTDEARGHWLIDTFAFSSYSGPIATALDGYFDEEEPYPTDKIRFPYLANPGLYTDDFTSGSGSVSDRNKRYPSVNARNASGLIFNNPNSGTFNNINYNSLAPYVRLRYVIDKMQEEFGLDMEGDVLSDSDFNALLFYTSRTLDLAQAFIGTRPFIFFKRSFNLDELVPEMACIDLLKELQKLLNFALYFNERNGRLRMKYRRDLIITRAFNDITTQVSPFVDFEDLSLKGIRLQQQVDDSDALAKTSQALHIFDSGTEPEETIPTEFSGFFFNATFNVDDAGTALNGPYAIQRAQTDRAARLIFYKGFTAATGFSYPSASANGVAYNLQLTDLNVKKYKEWLRFLKNRKLYKYLWDVDLPEILALDWEKKYRINRVDHLLKSVSVDLTMRGISRPEIEMYSI